MKVTVLLADDHKIMRDGLRALLEKEPGLEVIGEAADGRTAVALARELKPSVVVMDVAMPDLNGIEATKQIAAKAPGARVLALSMHADRRYVAGMLGAGATGYLLKDSAFEEVAHAIREIAADRPYVSAKIKDVVIEDYVHQMQRDEAPAESILTDREREVVQLLAEGVSVKEAATRLNLSVKTIETHRQHVMHKLEIHSLAELTKYAIREGLTSVEP